MLLVTLTALTLGSTVGVGGSAYAQSTGAPTGRDPATARGGTEGQAGLKNEMTAVRNGDAMTGQQ